MQRVYLHEGHGMYRRLFVADTAPYLSDGWFLSISEHQANVAKINKPPVESSLFGLPQVETKRKSRKKAK